MFGIGLSEDKVCQEICVYGAELQNIWKIVGIRLVWAHR